MTMTDFGWQCWKQAHKREREREGGRGRERGTDRGRGRVADAQRQPTKRTTNKSQAHYVLITCEAASACFESAAKGLQD